MEGLLERVAELKATAGYATEDRAAIRREIIAVEKRISERLGDIRNQVGEIDEECKGFRREAAEWRDRMDRKIGGLQTEVGAIKGTVSAGEGREQRKASTTIAWVGGGFVLATGLVQTAATVFGA